MTAPAPTYVLEPAGGRHPVERVSAVIVAHRDPTLALNCYESIRNQVAPGGAVLVVNDATNDDDISRQTQLKVIYPEQSRGYGANLNLGVGSLPTLTEFLLLLNDDTLVPEGTVARLVETLDNDPSAGMVGPLFVKQSGEITPSAFSLPSTRDFVRLALIAPDGIMTMLRFPDPTGNPGPVGWTLGAGLLIRTSVWKELHGFDEDFFLYSEETDLASRMWRAGWRVLHEPEASIQHIGGASTGESYRAMLGQSRSLYLRKHWSRPRRILLGCLLLTVYFWDILYIAMRTLVRPSTLNPGLTALVDRWVTRPFLQSLPGQLPRKALSFRARRRAA